MRARNLVDSSPRRDWKARLIRGAQIWDRAVPQWVTDARQTFEQNVGDPAYPCFFGGQALREGAIHYSFVDQGDHAHLPETLRYFLRECRDHPLANFAVFFGPVPGLTHDGARAHFWATLERLQHRDTDPGALGGIGDPDTPLWEFTFAGVQMFVVGASPTYSRRRSRNLGSSMVMLFQPRDVFDIDNVGKDAGNQARTLIRRRLRAWDGIAHHPALGTYGDPGNREWMQYFLPDDNEAPGGICPLHNRVAAETAS
jgi:FPC/CPF motif-containing protein YcgG